MNVFIIHKTTILLSSWPVSWNVSVELVAGLVPLHAVQLLPLHVKPEHCHHHDVDVEGKDEAEEEEEDDKLHIKSDNEETEWEDVDIIEE